MSNAQQCELWLEKPLLSRRVSAYHAGRLLNVFAWSLQQAWLLQSKKCFRQALDALNLMAKPMSILVTAPHAPSRRLLQDVRDDVQATWHAEWASDQLGEFNCELRENPECRRDDQCESMLRVFVADAVNDVRNCWQKDLDESEKWAFELGEGLDRIVRRQDAYRFMWKAELWDDDVDKASSATPTASVKGRQNLLANYAPLPGGLPVDGMAVQELGGLCVRCGLPDAVTTDVASLGDLTRLSQDQTVGHVERLDELIRKCFEGTGSAKVCRLGVVTKGPKPTATLDHHVYSISGDVADFLQALIDADGKPVSMTAYNVRTRDIDALHQPLRDLIERDPGKGTWIPRERLWLN